MLACRAAQRPRQYRIGGLSRYMYRHCFNVEFVHQQPGFAVDNSFLYAGVTRCNDRQTGCGGLQNRNRGALSVAGARHHAMLHKPWDRIQPALRRSVSGARTRPGKKPPGAPARITATAERSIHRMVALSEGRARIDQLTVALFQLCRSPGNIVVLLDKSPPRPPHLGAAFRIGQ